MHSHADYDSSGMGAVVVVNFHDWVIYNFACASLCRLQTNEEIFLMQTGPISGENLNWHLIKILCEVYL